MIRSLRPTEFDIRGGFGWSSAILSRGPDSLSPSRVSSRSHIHFCSPPRYPLSHNSLLTPGEKNSLESICMSLEKVRSHRTRRIPGAPMVLLTADNGDTGATLRWYVFGEELPLLWEVEPMFELNFLRAWTGCWCIQNQRSEQDSESLGTQPWSLKDRVWQSPRDEPCLFLFIYGLQLLRTQAIDVDVSFHHFKN